MANPKDKADIVLLQRKAPNNTHHAVQPLHYPVHHATNTAACYQICEPTPDYTPEEPPNPPKSNDPILWCVEDDFRDELAALGEASYFLHKMLEAFFDNEETSLSMNWSRAHDGLMQWLNWMQWREHRLRKLADEEYDELNSCIESSEKAGIYQAALAKSLSSLAPADRETLLDNMASLIGAPRSDVDKAMEDTHQQVREPGADYSVDPPPSEEGATELDVVGMVTKVTDQMDNLHALNSYFYIAIEGMMKDVEILDEEVLWGLWLNMRWLRERSEEVRSAVNELHRTLREAKNGDADQEEAPAQE